MSEDVDIGGITISPSLVYIGTVLPENVIIHLIQNAFNFITSSIAWVALMVVTQVITLPTILKTQAIPWYIFTQYSKYSVLRCS